LKRHVGSIQFTEVAMPGDEATAVIMFIASLYAFAIVLLYVLAKSWEQALSTRTVERGLARSGTPGTGNSIRRKR
jgi:hypothetical protein